MASKQLQSFHHVYILQCADGSHYTGCTKSVENRLIRHNRGEVQYTKSRLPIKLINVTSFPDKYQAYQYEKYLKSGSGRAFAKRHLV